MFYFLTFNICARITSKKEIKNAEIARVVNKTVVHKNTSSKKNEKNTVTKCI